MTQQDRARMAALEAVAEAAYSRGQNMGPWLSLPTKMKAEWRNDIRAALAAVAPLIAQAEREACARVAETHDWFVGGIGTMAPGSGQSRAIAAAIRARSTEEGQ